MIRPEEVFKIGKLIKPHGIKGEIAFEFDNDIFDRTDCPYLVCSIEGILVPFFIREYRFKGKDTALITFEDVTSDQKAKSFSGLDVYFPRKYFEESEEDVEYTLDYFIDFEIVDNNLGTIGTIVDIDDSTINTLFLLRNKNDEEIIIPASDDFITDIDESQKIIYVDLPIGLI
jgi:16S rRNA processing protein RimM